MKDKRILYVSSEVVPYLPETEIASTAFNVAKKAHSKGVQTRIFMPRFGVINERRHQLHEVIRLSGMNLIDLIEMFCDWKAATLRHADGDINKSIMINKKRFNISDQVVSIFQNSVDLFD